MKLIEWLTALLSKPHDGDVQAAPSPPPPGSAPDFDLAFDRLVGHEGKFTDNRKDRGNWTSGRVGVGELKGTKFGISAMSYPDLDIKNLTLEQAKAIYLRDYWLRAGADEYDGAIGYQVFDAAVNHGIENAVRILQRAVKVADDGDVGPLTMQAVKKMSVTDVLSRFNAQRIRFYTKLSTWSEFGKGWMNRVAGNLDYAAEDS
ncbi:MAG: secretion activator protein [Pusillimonas sp.]|jgi:lysozyme family protein|nr:secretion activator protein [Pusillimonas sp.]